MWYAKIFSKGDLTNGTLEKELAKEFLDEDGLIDYDEVVEHYENCRERIDNIIHFLTTYKTTRKSANNDFEIPF